MQTILLEPVENMPLSEENQQWVLEQIRQAVQPNGFKKFADRLRYWGLLGICITVVLALIGMVITLGVFATNKVSQESEFRGKTVEQLTSIDKRLGAAEGSLKLLPAQISTSKFSSLPAKDLKNHREELVEAKKSLVSVPQNTANFWPVAFQTITLLSQADFENFEAIASKQAATLSDVKSSPGAIAINPNQRIILKNHIEGLVFRNCVIVFDPSVILVNDTFIDCAFILPARENPPKVFQEIGRTLLASDLARVTLNAS